MEKDLAAVWKCPGKKFPNPSAGFVCVTDGNKIEKHLLVCFPFLLPGSHRAFNSWRKGFSSSRLKKSGFFAQSDPGPKKSIFSFSSQMAKGEIPSKCNRQSVPNVIGRQNHLRIR